MGNPTVGSSFTLGSTIWSFSDPDQPAIKFQSLAATPGVEFLVPVGQGLDPQAIHRDRLRERFRPGPRPRRMVCRYANADRGESRKTRTRLGTKVQWLSTFESDLVLTELLRVPARPRRGIPTRIRHRRNPAYLSPTRSAAVIDAAIQQPRRQSNRDHLHERGRPRLRHPPQTQAVVHTAAPNRNRLSLGPRRERSAAELWLSLLDPDASKGVEQPHGPALV